MSKRLTLLVLAAVCAGLEATAHAGVSTISTSLEKLFPSATKQAVACDERKPDGRMRALLIGVADYRLTELQLQGPQNEVPLLREMLLGRGIDAGDIRVLLGRVSRAEAVKALDDLIAQTRCGDVVFLYWGGQAHGQRGVDVALLLSDTPLEKPQDDVVVLPEDTIVSREMLQIVVTALRRRGGSVFLTIDAPFSARMRLAEIADQSWRWSPRQGRDESALPPDAGTFTGFYASHQRAAPEMRVPPGLKGKVYGLFAYVLATSLGGGTEITYRKLAEIMFDSYRAYFPVEMKIAPSPTFESTSPDEPALQAPGKRANAAGNREYRIEMLQPAPTRGLTRAEAAKLRVEARVVPGDAMVAAFVNNSPARLAKDGHFVAEVDLQPGRNRVFVNAMIGKDRFVADTFEVLHEAAAAAPRGRGYALLIANDEYRDKRWSRLVTPAPDVAAVAKMLSERFGYAIEIQLDGGRKLPLVLRNASRKDVLSRLSRLREVLTEEDTLVVYYAGHGHYDKEIDKAYWIPIDDDIEDVANWISSSDVSDQLKRMNVRHILVVADSCFSGGLFRDGTEERRAILDPKERVRILDTLGQRRSRFVISSGSNEPVTDVGGGGHSVFARAFLNALGRVPPGGASVGELFAAEMRDFVLANSKQSPQYRPIPNIGHDGGDLVFRMQ